MKLFTLLSFLVLQAACTDANNTIKFRYWYGTAASTMDAAAQQCASEIEGYRNGTQLRPPYSPCGLAQDCLLSNTPEYSKANYAAAGVLLGLMPTMLGFIGPNLQDTAVITIRRPLLASLMVAGAPAISPVPFLSSTAEHANVKPSAVMLAVGRRFLPGSSNVQPHVQSRTPFAAKAVFILSTMQYLLVLLSLANTIHNTVELDFRSTVVWHCSSVGYPEAWALSSVLLHWVSAASVWCRARVETSPGQGRRRIVAVTPSAISSRLLTGIRRWAASEPIPSLFEPVPEWIHFVGSSTVTSEILSWISSLLALFHYVLGTLVFSSLLFIGVQDAVIVLFRFVGSAIVCRLLLWFELDGLNIQVQGRGEGTVTEKSEARPNTMSRNDETVTFL